MLLLPSLSSTKEGLTRSTHYLCGDMIWVRRTYKSGWCLSMLTARIDMHIASIISMKTTYKKNKTGKKKRKPQI